MKLYRLSFLFFLSLMISCKSIVSLHENTNRKSKFENTNSYLENSSQKNHFSKEKIIVLNDSIFNILINEIISKKLSTYYGITDKDHFVSADQLNIKSCSGQIVMLYKLFDDNAKEIKKQEIAKINLLANFNLNSSKTTLLFLYSYKLGGLSKNKINSVIEQLEKQNDFDYRIISLDNYDIINR